MQPVAMIQVALYPDGNVRVAGPIQDKVLCYGMLERAKDAVRDWTPPAVEVPGGGVARKLLGHNGDGG